MTARYTSELANGLGNLASRVAAMVGKYFDGVLPAPTDAGPAEPALADGARAGGRDRRRGDRATLRLPRALAAIYDFVDAVNGYVTEQEPWEVAKDDVPERRRDLDRDPLHRGRGAARGRRAAQPGDAARRPRALWTRSAPRPRSGRSPTSGCRTPAPGASCPPGRTVTKGAPLFPRIEEPDACVSARRRRPARARRRVGGPRRRPPAARAARGAGGRQPLPPRHRRPAGRLARRSTTRSPRRPPSACPRIVQIGCDLPGRAVGGRGRRASTTQLVAGVALHPNEAPRLARGRRRSTRRSPRSTRSPPTRGVRAVGETGLDYFRTGDGRARRPGGVVPRAHRDGQAARQGAGDPRPRRARRRAARARATQGAPDRVVFHCFSGDAGDGASTASTRGWLPVLRRHVTFKNAAGAARRRWRSRRSTGCWSRPTRRT